MRSTFPLRLQHHQPDDYVLATGQSHSVRDFVEEVASCLDFDLVWHGEGLDETGVDRNTNKTIVKIDPYFFRPTEVEYLLGDPTKAKKELGWIPKVTFKDLVSIMVNADYQKQKVRNEKK